MKKPGRWDGPEARALKMVCTCGCEDSDWQWDVFSLGKNVPVWTRILVSDEDLVQLADHLECVGFVSAHPVSRDEIPWESRKDRVWTVEVHIGMMWRPGRLELAREQLQRIFPGSKWDRVERKNPYDKNDPFIFLRLDAAVKIGL